MPTLRMPLIALGCASALATIGATASAEPVGEQFRVSSLASADLVDAPSVAANLANGESLIAWAETELGAEAVGYNDTVTVFVRRIAASGAPASEPVAVETITTGSAGLRPGTPGARAKVAYNSVDGEYLVVWAVDDAPNDELVDSGDQKELFARRVATDGSTIGETIRFSGFSLDPGDESAETAYFGVDDPVLGYDPALNEYLVAWSGAPVSTVSPVALGNEIFGLRIDSGGQAIDIPLPLTDTPDDATAPGSGAYTPEIAAESGPAPGWVLVWRSQVDLSDPQPDLNGLFVRKVSGEGLVRGPQTRIASGSSPAIASGLQGEYLVAWSNGELRTQRLNADLRPIGMQAPRQASPAAVESSVSPRVSFSPEDGEYLVAWAEVPSPPRIAPADSDVFSQRFSAGNVPIGEKDRVSDRAEAPTADPTNFGAGPDLAYNPIAGGSMIAWEGRPSSPPAPEGNRIQAIAAKVPAVPAKVQNACRERDENNPVTSGGGVFELSEGQIRINQRIGQAAIRRANGLQDWLDGGVQGVDICGDSLLPRNVGPGLLWFTDLQSLPGVKPAPRPVAIAAAADKGVVKFEVTARQLQINQRIYSTALRRINGLRERIDGNLTGGDIVDGSIGRDRFNGAYFLSPGTDDTPAPKPSTTKVAPKSAGSATFTPTVKQLRINQKIAQAAVKRTNELRATLQSGLTGENFADGSITAVDFAP